MIGEMTKTDKGKSGHGFLDKYEFLLRDIRKKELKILEIGVLKGASLMMWRHIYCRGHTHELF